MPLSLAASAFGALHPVARQLSNRIAAVLDGSVVPPASAEGLSSSMTLLATVMPVGVASAGAMLQAGPMSLGGGMPTPPVIDRRRSMYASTTSIAASSASQASAAGAASA